MPSGVKCRHDTSMPGRDTIRVLPTANMRHGAKYHRYDIFSPNVEDCANAYVSIATNLFRTYLGEFEW